MSKTYGISPKEIHEVREKIREKVNYRCYFCNRDIRRIGLKCSTHHIVPKALLKKDYWNEDNLLVLCCYCHNKLEKLNRMIFRFILSKDKLKKMGCEEKMYNTLKK